MRIAIFLGFILFFLSCSENRSKERPLNVFRYNESVGVSSLDPAQARTNSQIWPVNQLFNGLIQMDDSLNIMPCIAKTWEISEDGLIYTFHLRNDVFFHNHPVFREGKGRLVRAQDFVYSFNRILDPEIASSGRWVFQHISDRNPDYPEGFFAVNDSTLVIELNEAFSPFLSLLSIPYCFVVPKEVCEYEKGNFGRNPIGTGPFQFKLWKEDEKLIFVRNENYFEKDENNKPYPYLDGVAISFIKDKQSEFMEFMLGNSDLLSGVHPSYKDELLTRSGELNPRYKDKFQLNSEAYLNTEYLAFLVENNFSDSLKNPLLDINVRKAINYGFDRKKMIKYLRNNIGEAALHGIVPSGMSYYNQDEIIGYAYNPDTALYFLELAGYPIAEGLGTITLTTTADYLDLCEYIQFELQKIGIEIKLELSTGAAFRNLVANSNLEFFRASWIADYPDPESYLSLFYSGNFSPEGPNYTHFSSAEYDSLYILSNKTLNNEIRKEIMQQMDQMIINNAVIVPLYYDQVLRFTPISIKNFPTNPMNLLKLKTVRKESGY